MKALRKIDGYWVDKNYHKWFGADLRHLHEA